MTRHKKRSSSSAHRATLDVFRHLKENRLEKASELAESHFVQDPTSERAKKLLIEVYRRQSEHEHMSPRDWLIFIVQIAQFGVVEDWMSREYFSHLESYLEARRPRRRTPGKLILGLGTGRCGSTSLAMLLDRGDDFYVTHEVPPIVYWSPTDAQLSFHSRRLEILSRYYACVGDVAHWWLNCLGSIRTKFPEAFFVGVRRDTDQTVKSFEQIKGRGKGAINHWQRHDGTHWSKNIWDPCYPKTGTPCTPRSSAVELDEQRRIAIKEYIESYNRRMESDESVLVLSLEELNDHRVVDKLSEHIGIKLTHEKNITNVKGIEDSHWQGRF